VKTLLILCLAAGPAYSADTSVAKNRSKDLSKRPLQISADETISRNRGKNIVASGNVSVKYLLENGDRLESVSDFAKYNHTTSVGEVWGNPDALWLRNDPQEPRTRLRADKIIIRVNEYELDALGHAQVLQSSSTLTAEKISYSNKEKKMTALGERPEFTIQQTEHFTKISAKKIVALTEDKEIHFSENVRGIVNLRDNATSP